MSSGSHTQATSSHAAPAAFRYSTTQREKDSERDRYTHTPSNKGNLSAPTGVEILGNSACLAHVSHWQMSTKLPLEKTQQGARDRFRLRNLQRHVALVFSMYIHLHTHTFHARTHTRTHTSDTCPMRRAISTPSPSLAPVTTAVSPARLGASVDSHPSIQCA